MMRSTVPQRIAAVAALCAAVTLLPGLTLAAPTTAQKRVYFPTTLKPYTPKTFPDHGLEDKLTPQGRKARGFYLTPYYLNRVGPEKSAAIMKRANMNAVVIDIKDDFGQVLWASDVPLSKEVQLNLVKDPKQLIETFHAHGIYVIARLVCFKDSRLPYVRPDLSVRLGAKGGRLFRAGAGWVDQYSDEVKDYLIELALEWEAYGADEIQLDYIRFPKGKMGKLGVWLHKKPESPPRDQLIADFLQKFDRALRIPLSVDIFGLTTFVDGDPRGLGQTIEKMSDFVEVISPMMYANGMGAYFKDGVVSENVYSLLHCGLWRARQKAPSIVLRPYLQAYPNGVPFFGGRFIRNQVNVAGKAGSEGFLFWNSSMKNQTALSVLRSMKSQLETFGDGRDSYNEPDRRPPSWCRPPGRGDVFKATP